MPPVSQKQARFFRAVASGKAKAGGMSPEKAKEMVSGYSTHDLPKSASTFKRAVAKRKGK